MTDLHILSTALSAFSHITFSKLDAKLALHALILKGICISNAHHVYMIMICNTIG